MAEDDSMPEDPRAYLKHACECVSRDCCRTLFVEADDFVEETREALAGNLGDEDLKARLEELGDHLESGCCQSSLVNADELAEAARERAGKL